MNPHYSFVAARAGERCEYCRAAQRLFSFALEVEHIVPLARGGLDVEQNWALACRSCNLFKGAQLTAVDPQTGARVPLFHPREQLWDTHFALDSAKAQIVGRTATGRATVEALNMNATHHQQARRLWIVHKLYP